MSRSWVQSYYPTFNGIRAVAILAVFTCHFGPIFLGWRWLESLWFGVDIFFVLSGFLITGILHDSLNNRHFFRDFYVRRALRIFPLFYALFAVILVTVLCRRAYVRPIFWATPLYLMNFTTPFANWVWNNPDDVYLFAHGRTFEISMGYLWSLCVEEQFYLVWPFVVFAVRSRVKLMRVAIWGVGLVIVSRVVLYYTLPSLALRQLALYMLPFARFDSLLIGAWCALWVRESRPSRHRLRQACSAVGCGSLLLLALGSAHSSFRWPYQEINLFWSGAGYTLVALASAAMLLWSLDERTLLHKLLCWRPLAELGTVSYGFYVLHNLPELPLAKHLRAHSLPTFQACAAFASWFAIVFCLAWLSYRFYESPFLRFKKVLAPGHRSVPSGKVPV